MRHLFGHLHLRELRLLGLVAVALLLIAGQLGSALGPEPTEGGWRRVDIEAVRARIEKGELSNREAVWARPTEVRR